jgi:hypothetical protein
VRARIFLACVALSIVLCNSLTAATTSDVFIRSGHDGQGRGFLVSRDKECFAIAPYHVSKLSPTITVIGDKARQSTAQEERHFSEDIAILRVTDRTLCDSSSTFPIVSELSEIFNRSSEGIVRSKNEDGSWNTMPVYLKNIDDVTVTVSPKQQGAKLTQGDSGSLLSVEGSPAAILLSIRKDGSGSTYRLDRVRELVSFFFHFSARATPVTTPALHPCDACDRWDGERCVSRCLEQEKCDSKTGTCVDRCLPGEKWTPQGCVGRCKEGEKWENGLCVSRCSTEECERWSSSSKACVSRCDDSQRCENGRCVTESPVGKGLPPGTGTVTCGCWGFVNPGARRPNSKCASGYDVAQSCGLMCPAGGYAWGAVCE